MSPRLLDLEEQLAIYKLIYLALQSAGKAAGVVKKVSVDSEMSPNNLKVTMVFSGLNELRGSDWKSRRIAKWYLSKQNAGKELPGQILQTIRTHVSAQSNTLLQKSRDLEEIAGKIKVPKF